MCYVACKIHCPIWTFSILLTTYDETIRGESINFGKYFCNLIAKTFVNILYNASIKEIGRHWWNDSGDANFGTNLTRSTFQAWGKQL